jgi:hypothetical protein
MIYIALEVLIVLIAIAGLILLFSAIAYIVGWLVGLGFRFVPLAGRRHRSRDGPDPNRWTG